MKNIVPGVDVLIAPEALDRRVAEMGAQITRDYLATELHVVGILKGSFMFLADLVRHIERPMSIDFLGLSSYGAETTTSGVVKIVKDLSEPIEGKDVLIVEDIVDTGLTLSYLLENLKTRQPKSVKICALLDKPVRRVRDVNVDYVGFTIKDNFVIGYGLDFAEKYRNLPYIGEMKAN